MLDLQLLYCLCLGFKHGLVCADFRCLPNPPRWFFRDPQIPPSGFRKCTGLSHVYFQVFLPLGYLEGSEVFFRMYQDPVLSARATCTMTSPAPLLGSPAALLSDGWESLLSQSFQTQAGPACWCPQASQAPSTGCHFISEGMIAPSVLWVSNLCRLACGATSYRDFWHLALSFIWLNLPSLGLWHESLEPGA